jgi:phosphate transport system substrate-binding protein
VDYVELPIAYDGLAVVVNPKNTWATTMTVAELKKLWEPAAQGTVRRWNQIRSGWPDQEIHLFGAGVDSGTFDYFTEAIVGKEDQSRGDYTSSENDNLIVQGVSGDEYALGYFGYAYYEENKDKLKLLGIDDGDDTNGKGPILPSPETVKDGTYRPLSRPIFIYPKVKSLARPEVQRFVEYYLTEGVPLVREVGYIPLTDREYELARARLAGRKAGSMYQGTDSRSPLTLEQRLAQ